MVITDEEETRVKSINLEEEIHNVNRNESITYEELPQKFRKKIELLRGNRGEGAGKKVDDKKVKNDGKKRKRGEMRMMGRRVARRGMWIGGEEKEEEEEEHVEGEDVEEGEDVGGGEGGEHGCGREGVVEGSNQPSNGVKVHDDARMIKESVKKEKNAEKWKERVETQEKMKKEK
ncbi:ribosomal RNA-proCES [Forsythia ovata]|uniref:Ribosomal RNA-proCES n=1 Tax=Forsythia ovata TaxID=205694 RepID=A0ABD1S7B6_9LAMI